VGALIQALPQLLSLVMFFIKKIQGTPAQNRRKSLADLDKAFKKAKKNDLRRLSKWFGSRL